MYVVLNMVQGVYVSGKDWVCNGVVIIYRRARGNVRATWGIWTTVSDAHHVVQQPAWRGRPCGYLDTSKRTSRDDVAAQGEWAALIRRLG